MAAIGIIGDSEVAGPWLDGIGFLPQFLGLGSVVLQLSPFFSSFFTYSGTSGEVKSVAGVFVLL